MSNQDNIKDNLIKLAEDTKNPLSENETEKTESEKTETEKTESKKIESENTESEDKVLDSKKTIKTALFNTIANMISLIIGVVAVPVIARVISQEDLGIASTFLANRNIIVIIAMMAIYSYINKAMLEFSDRKKDYIYSITVFCVAVTIGLFVICLPLKSQIMKLLSLDDFLFYWLFVSIFAFSLFNIAYYYCLFHNYSKILVAIVLSVGPVSQVISISMAFVMSGKKYIGRVIGLDMTYLIISIILIICLFRQRGKVFQGVFIKESLKFTVPIIPHLLSQTVLTQCDLIMISYFCGEDKSGIYSMGHTVGFLALTVMQQLMASWSPWVFRRLEDKDSETVKNNSSLMIILGMFMSIGLMSISPELIKIFLTDAYLPCIYILPPLIVAMFFQFIYLFFYDLEYYHKKSKWIATASVIAAGLNIILNVIFIKKYGYVAASYTTLFCYFVLLLVNGIFAAKLDVKNTYNMKMIITTCIAVVAYMVFCFVFIDRIIVRYAVLICIAIVLISMLWKKLLSFLVVLKG